MILHETITDKEAFARLRRSLFDLMVYAPLAGLTILGGAIRLQERASCKTMATDGRNLYYGTAWVRKKSQRSNTWDLLHEWLHIFGNHVARRGAREHKLWNYCCDVRVAHDCLKILNSATLADAVSRWDIEPDHVPALPWAAHLTPEQIYEEFEKKEEKDKPDLEDYEDDDLLPPSDSTTPESEEKFLKAFTDDLAKATVALEHLGTDIRKAYGDHVASRLEKLQQGRIPWDRLMQGRVVDQLGKTVATWAKPNFRFLPDLLLPGSFGDMHKELFIGVDVSTSVDQELLNRFASNIANAAARAKKIVVCTFDAEVREVIVTNSPAQVMRQLKLNVGQHSSTSTVGMFRVIEQHRPAAMVCFTDGFVELPVKQYPAMTWIIPEGGRVQPWGRSITMQLSW